MPASTIGSGNVVARRQIRSILGRRLREYCDSVQYIPASERLTELVKELAKDLEEQENQ